MEREVKINLVTGTDIVQTANTHKINACNRALVKTSKQNLRN
jgi:hypothetical protein